MTNGIVDIPGVKIVFGAAGFSHAIVLSGWFGKAAIDFMKIKGSFGDGDKMSLESCSTTRTLPPQNQ
jgi:hypothetical protein